MKVYLDTCTVQRPLDSKTQIRIVLEAEAVQGVIALCERGELRLVSSDMLMFEIKRIVHPIRRDYALQLLSKANERVRLNQAIQRRADEFVKAGIKALDALHLASAEWAKVDYFCTCDDKFLKRAKAIENVTVTVLSPIELTEVLE